MIFRKITVLFSLSVLLLTATAVLGAQPSVTNTSGKVMIDGKPAEPGETTLEVFDFNTRQGDSSFVDIELQPSQSIRLRNARGSLSKQDQGYEIDLEQGELFYGDNMKGPASFTINTDNAIAAIRGTKFYIKSTPEQTYVCVCEGTVSARKTGFWSSWFGETIEVNKGQDAHIYGDREMPEPKDNPQMINWTWQELQDMGFDRPE